MPTVRMSEDPNDFCQDGQILPSRASEPQGEMQRSGRELAEIVRKVALPITPSFLTEFEGVEPQNLVAFARDHNISFDGGLLYLYLTASKAIPYNRTEILSAFDYIQVTRSSPSSLRPYYRYFAQDLMYKGMMKVSPAYFEPEQFQDGRKLPPYFLYRSLILQVWGGVKKVSDDFSQGIIESPTDFEKQEYLKDALVLASAFSENPYGIFPTTYIEKLKAEHEGLMKKAKRSPLWPYFAIIDDYAKEWVACSPSPASVVQPSAEGVKGLKASALKVKGVEASPKPKKSVNFPKEYESAPPKRGRVIVTREASPGNNLFEYFVNLFHNDVTFQTALEGALQHGSEWLITHEQSRRGLLPDYKLELRSSAITQADLNSFRNSLDVGDEFPAGSYLQLVEDPVSAPVLLRDDQPMPEASH